MFGKISMKSFPAISLAVLAGLALAGETRAASLAFQNAVLADNPIAYYQFSELPGALVAHDAAGGYDGSYSTTGVTLGQTGIGGGDTGAHFDGTGSGRVLVPDAPALNPSLITIESLMRWDGPNGFQQRLIEKSFFLDGTQALYNLSILDDGRVQAEFRSSGQVILTGTTVMTPGESHHLATTFDLGTFNLYVDGVLEASLAHPFPGNYLQSSPQTIGIGNQFERDRAFNGLIDELAIYDRALSQMEIQSHLAAVPVPAAAWLFGSGLLGLIGMARRREKDRQPMQIKISEQHIDVPGEKINRQMKWIVAAVCSGLLTGVSGADDGSSPGIAPARNEATGVRQPHGSTVQGGEGASLEVSQPRIGQRGETKKQTSNEPGTESRNQQSISSQLKRRRDADGSSIHNSR